MEEMKVFCVNCGTANVREAAFCNECGAKLPEIPGAAASVVPNAGVAAGGPDPAAAEDVKAKAEAEEAKEKATEVKKESKSDGSKREPVAGWIVCISGESRGEDFRIRAGNNRIGNTDAAEICLDGNAAVSGDNIATIAYYTKQNSYYVIPGDGTGVVKINGETVEIPTVLPVGAVITIGECEYKFIPLCSDDFKW